MYYVLAFLITILTGCFGPGMYADSEILSVDLEDGKTFSSQSFPFFKYPVGEKEKKELTEFVMSTGIYKQCISTNGHPVATYQEGLMGSVTIICEGNDGSTTTIEGTIIEEDVDQFEWLKETGDKR